MRLPRLDFSPLLTVVLVLVSLGLVGCGASPTINNDPPPGTSGPISGLYVDGSTGEPVAGAIVFLEQADMSGIDRVVKSTTTAGDGTFAFPDVAAGNYDLVGAASVTASGSTTTYATTMTLAVPANTNLQSAPLFPEYGNSMPYGLPVDLGGGGLASASGNSPAQVDVQLSPLQSVMRADGSTVQVTIPVFADSTPLVTTAPGSACPGGTDCAAFSLLVPASSPVVGTYNPDNINYTNPSYLQEVRYMVEGKAFVHGTDSPDCSPTSQTVGPVVPRGTLASRIPNLSFTGCQ